MFFLQYYSKGRAKRFSHIIQSPFDDKADKNQMPEKDICKSSKEKFVEIVASDLIEVRMQYPRLKMKHAFDRCFVRERIAFILHKAAESLPEGWKLCIWDAWRPFSLQKELFEVYSAQIIDDFGWQNLPAAEQRRRISQFVADPIEDINHPPAHTTGGAVDITLLTPDGSYVDMGVGFDEFTDRTETSWYERNAPDSVVAANRKKLMGIMSETGLVNLPSEIWHWEYGDENWSRITGKPAIYEGVFSEREILEMIC